MTLIREPQERLSRHLESWVPCPSLEGHLNLLRGILHLWRMKFNKLDISMSTLRQGIFSRLDPDLKIVFKLKSRTKMILTTSTRKWRTKAATNCGSTQWIRQLMKTISKVKNLLDILSINNFNKKLNNQELSERILKKSSLEYPASSLWENSTSR